MIWYIFAGIIIVWFIVGPVKYMMGYSKSPHSIVAASKKGDIKLVKKYIERGADVNYVSIGITEVLPILWTTC